MDEKEIMTVKQVAEYLQIIDEHTVYKLACTGLILFLKIAGQWRFKKELIDKWMNKEALRRLMSNIRFYSKCIEKALLECYQKRFQYEKGDGKICLRIS